MTQCRFGFALQETQGAFVLPNNWVPLIESELHHAEGWVEGSVRFALVPEMMDTALDISRSHREKQGKSLMDTLATTTAGCDKSRAYRTAQSRAGKET